MAEMIFVSNVSLDGFIEDDRGDFEWTAPSDEVLGYITDLVRPLRTHLYGRRLYETMAVWESDPALASRSELMADFAHVWQAADKVVYSTKLEAVFTARSRLERRFDAGAVRAIKAAGTGGLMIGGSNLAAQAFRAGLVDECHLFIHPVVVGRGKPSLPGDLRAQLELLDERRFDNGVVYVRYRLRP